MTFYLGTHMPGWLRQTTIPLFVSRRRLARYKTLPRAAGRWALDSGGFTELSMFGRWETSPQQYAEEALRFVREIGRLDFAAIQDWMCEPFIIEKTGLSVREHQERSVQSYLDLRALASFVPWVPVLQGWTIDDYFACADLYESAGVRLAELSRVGVGSVCRRQGTKEATDLFAALRSLRCRLHGFGLKTQFIKPAFGLGLASFDSLAWSLAARKRGKPLDGCTGHVTCANCRRYAELWRDTVISLGRKPRQLLMDLEGRRVPA